MHRSRAGPCACGGTFGQIIRGSDLRFLCRQNSKGVSLDSNAAIRRYFEPSLAALIIKDRREARGEVGKLGSDPFIDAQDWEIDNVDVAVRDTGSDKASATVSFKNLGEQQTLVLALVKLKAGWRIADITWYRNGTLRGLLTKK